MRTVSKKQAMEIKKQKQAEGFFLWHERYDMAKYKYDGSLQPFINMEVPTLHGILAVWPERRQDVNGPYMILMCISLF